MGISWETAFNNALAFILYSFLWDIIGSLFIIFGAGSVVSLIMMHVGLSNTSTQLSGPSLLASLGFFIIGLILILLGNIATFLKVFGDTITDEVERRSKKSENTPKYIEKLK